MNRNPSSPFAQAVDAEMDCVVQGERASQKSEKELRELEGIRRLLSHLHGEIMELSSSYTEVLRVLHRFEDLCSRDQLTQLLNREAFFRKWSMLVLDCMSSESFLGIIAVDIDHFKQVNDTFGHSVGDEVIQRVAGLLREFESQEVLSARFGGEEFILGFKSESREEAFFLAESLRKRVEQSTGTGPQCTVSVGLSLRQFSGEQSKGVPGANREVGEQMIQEADQALYSAKRSGRNQVKLAA